MCRGREWGSGVEGDEGQKEIKANKPLSLRSIQCPNGVA